MLYCHDNFVPPHRVQMKEHRGSTSPLLRESHFARLNEAGQISVQGEEGLVGIVHEEEGVLHCRGIKALLSQQLLLPFERACEEGEIGVLLMYVRVQLGRSDVRLHFVPTPALFLLGRYKSAKALLSDRMLTY